MCGWCWGFKPTWEKIVKRLSSNTKAQTQIQIKYLLGGLAPDSDIPMPETMQKEIAGYWHQIQKHIPNTHFNFDFWDKCQPRRSTYPACRAVIAARNQNPLLEKTMIEAIQKAYYLEAKNPSNDTTLIHLANLLALDEQRFSEDLNSEETQLELELEINLSRQIGAQGFPSLILQTQETYKYVPLDYNNPETCLNFIKKNI